MKAYIVCLEFVDLKPLVWRQVVLPYGTTFHRLHETIQVVTNFSSRYGFAAHLYAFNLPQERLWITNEPKEEMHTGFSSQPWQVKNPSRIKIDSYLEKYGQLNYTYDFGDDWRLQIRLENVVDDYHFGYPTLLAGVVKRLQRTWADRICIRLFWKDILTHHILATQLPFLLRRNSTFTSMINRGSITA